jgi:hypothetical protein
MGPCGKILPVWFTPLIFVCLLPQVQDSDKAHCVTFVWIDFAGVRVEVQRGGSLSAASGISAAAVYEVCGGLGRWDRGCMQPPDNLPP